MSTRELSRTLKRAAKDGVREAVTPAEERAVPMFAEDEAEGFRARWDGVQTGFVDEPRKAVEEADSLVAQVITRLSEVFADERANLEGQWGRGDQISTEDLRVALRKYRSFFERLLTL
jgi:hypothetical protein